MEYYGKIENARVRIVATSGWLARYAGQECNAIIYAGTTKPQIDTEQLNPPLPKWQSAAATDLEILP